MALIAGVGRNLCGKAGGWMRCMQFFSHLVRKSMGVFYFFPTQYVIQYVMVCMVLCMELLLFCFILSFFFSPCSRQGHDKTRTTPNETLAGAKKTSQAGQTKARLQTRCWPNFFFLLHYRFLLLHLFYPDLAQLTLACRSNCL